MAPERDNPKGRRERTAGAGRSTLVLVVDDFQDSREMCVEYLSFLGYRVAEAGDGYEALHRARQLRPDVILMDLSLPGIDGWEVTRRLKSDPEMRGIPIVAVTAHALPGDADRARRAGCDEFVTKPCFLDELLEKIEQVTHAVGAVR
ncbi:MAG: response regulator [Acidobacteria bacterium]|nr:response regulator [Acidobacteriota bacterium]